MGFAVLVLARVNISVGENVGALAMFETKFPLALISISVLPLMHTVPIRFRLQPLTDVRVAKNTLPDALTLFQPIFPLTFVDFTVEPCVNALSMGFVIFEVSFVPIAVGVAFHTPAVPIIVEPLTLIQSTRAIIHYTKTMSFPIN